MARKKQEDPPRGLAPWVATFGDLMNLLLCFFVLLFSMSTINAVKFQEIAASLANSFSVFSGGAMAIGEGVLISSGVSQLRALDDQINSMGSAESDEETDAREEFRREQLEESEEMAEEMEQEIRKNQLADEVDIDFTAQYVTLTLNGGILFDSGSVQIKKNALPMIDKLGQMLQKYESNVIEIEGHTDNVPIAARASKFKDNNELSSFRALSVFEYLVETTELEPAKLKHSGRGEYIPIADNTTPEGRSKNRRVEIKIYNSLSGY